MQDSQKMLEDQLGKRAALFAYPYSGLNSRVQRIVAESGYDAACSGDRGPWDLFNIWRSQCVRDDRRAAFACKANGWHQRYTWFREQSPWGPPLRRSVRTVKSLLRKTA